MVYEKQIWNKYDDLKTEEENIQNGAVVTDNRMNHMEDGISAIDLEVTSHESNKTNPHSVTKGQVGLSNVSNYGIATEAEATAGTSNAKYMTPLLTKKALNDSNIVHKTGNESIAGTKTFKNNVYLNGGIATKRADYTGLVTYSTFSETTGRVDYMRVTNSTDVEGTAGTNTVLIKGNRNIAGQTTNNMVVGIGTGATLVLGGGEGHQAYMDAMEAGKVPAGTPSGGAENIILASDNETYIGSNYQGGGVTGNWWKFGTDGILTAPGTIKAPTFSGKLDGNATSATTATTTTGNAGTATKLGTARKINGTAFDGTKDINVKASNDSDIVHKSGDEAITGKKTFTNDMVVKNIEVTGDYKKSTDTEMINLPLSGVATATVSYQRKNGVVFVKGGGNWGNFEANKSRIVGTLPVGFRPPVAWPSGMNAMGGSQSMSASVGADGGLGITCDIKKDGVYGGFSMSFPVE